MGQKAQKNIIKVSSRKTRDYWEIPVLYEDENLLAIDKPTGLHTRPDELDPHIPALNLLLVDHIERSVQWTVDRGIKFLKPAHELDAEASGILILGKSEEACEAIHDQFYSHDFLIEYQMIVQGTPVEDEFSVDAKVAPHGKRPGVYCVSKSRGKKAITQFKVLEHFMGYSLINAKCSPNRQHQARVHMRYLGPSLVGDQTYNGGPLLLSRIKPKYRLKRNKTERPLLSRAAIHANTIHIKKPFSEETLNIESPLPKDFEVSLKYLRQYANPTGFNDESSYTHTLDDYS